MTDTDQDLLDRFAIAAMGVVETHGNATSDRFAERCWQVAIEMKQARDRIFQTAQPAQMPPQDFPKIDPKELDEKIPLTPSQEERLEALKEMAELGHGFEPFQYCERS